VNSLRMDEKNSMPRKKNDDDFRNVLIDFRADVAPIETSYWPMVLEEERDRGWDGGPIENDLEVVVVQDVHDEGGGVESCSTLRVAASCSILVLHVVENNHILQKQRIESVGWFMTIFRSHQFIF
jgi:hypothetical protein